MAASLGLGSASGDVGEGVLGGSGVGLLGSKSAAIMATVSSDLLWELTKDNNTFKLKQAQITLSSDPYNLTNVHSQTYAGLAQTSAVGVSVPKATDSKLKKRSSTVRVKRLSKHGVVGKASHEVCIKVKGAVLGGVRRALLGKVLDRKPHLLQAAEKRLKRLHNLEFPRKQGTPKSRKSS